LIGRSGESTRFETPGVSPERGSIAFRAAPRVDYAASSTERNVHSHSRKDFMMRLLKGLICVAVFGVTINAIALAAGQGAADKSASPADKKEAIVQATYLITGLHCPPCTTTVEQSLRRAPGVRSIKVDWRTQNAHVEFDENVVSAQKVATLVSRTPHMMG